MATLRGGRDTRHIIRAHFLHKNNAGHAVARTRVCINKWPEFKRAAAAVFVLMTEEDGVYSEILH